MALPTYEELRRYFYYDPEEGDVYQIRPEGGLLLRKPKLLPQKALKNGSPYITYRNRQIATHVFVVRYQTNINASTFRVVHLDGDKRNNAWDNLKLSNAALHALGRPLEAFVKPQDINAIYSDEY